MIQNRSFDLRHKDGIVFNEENHSYFNATGEQYESSTGIIKKYKAPFYDDQTAKYKAIKEILPENHFRALKKHAGGWENIHTFWDKLMEREWADALIERKDFHLAKWKHEAELGTLEHSKREQEIISNGGIEFQGLFYEYINTDVLSIPSTGRYCLTEMLIWDHSMKLGGLADLPVFDNGTFMVLDYKTNKKIERSAFMNKRMLPPFGMLQDCNFMHYSLQLSIYANMISQLTGFKHKENWIISTANLNYGRATDELIKCEDLTEDYLLLKALLIGE
jgi:hypothetical protein